MADLWSTFAACAEAQPAAPALIFGDRVTSFGELRDTALSCAAGLAARGIGQGAVVALQVPKCRLAYGLLLACLRLGAPYVFIDPRSPAERTARILERVKPALLFTAADKPAAPVDVVHVTSEDRTWLDGNRLASSHVPITGSDPAYIMFTSGSTGEPKGAVIPHQGVLSLMRWAREAVGAGPGQRFTNINPLHFDNSVFDIYCGLFNGGTLVPIETASISNPALWARTVRTAQATVMFAVPTLFLVLDQLGLLTPAALPTVRTFLFGGEGYPIGKLRNFHHRFAGHARLINVYGPTETSCICSSVEIMQEHVQAADSQFPPLGRMHENFSHMILDEERRPVPAGTAGELWIGGPCVGLGYYANPQETAARFCQDPRQDRYHAIWYRTGDLVREHDGQLWFQGRADNQVKIRGYRIELEEIDLAVQSIPEVRRAVTAVLQGPDGPELGVAFVADREIEADRIGAVCKQKLPSYMQPSVVVQFPELPHNANGKVDRRAAKTLLERAV